MRSAKIGVARQIERQTKPMSGGRKISTSSRGTVNSLHSQPEHHPSNSQVYTRKELKEYRQLFNMFDTDGSGAIGNEELKQAMMSIGMHANQAEIDNVIKEVDADGNGEIDFEEFCACMKKSQSIVKSTNEELIRECFEIFDQDGNGVITENEFKYIAKEFGDFTDELAEKVFRELDVSDNGHLSADQFATIVEDYLLRDPIKYGEDGTTEYYQDYYEPPPAPGSGAVLDATTRHGNSISPAPSTHLHTYNRAGSKHSLASTNSATKCLLPPPVYINDDQREHLV